MDRVRLSSTAGQDLMLELRMVAWGHPPNTHLGIGPRIVVTETELNLKTRSP